MYNKKEQSTVVVVVSTTSVPSRGGDVLPQQHCQTQNSFSNYALRCVRGTPFVPQFSMCPHWSCHLYAPVRFSVNKTSRRRIPLLMWIVMFIAAVAAYLLCFILFSLLQSLLGEGVIVRARVRGLLQHASAALAMLRTQATTSHTEPFLRHKRHDLHPGWP